MSRQRSRAAFDVETRLTLVEGDADAADAERRRIRAELLEEIRHIADDVKTMKTTMIGILVAVTTASILLALQLAI